MVEIVNHTFSIMDIFPPVLALGRAIPDEISIDAQKECPPNGRMFIYECPFMSVLFLEEDW